MKQSLSKRILAYIRKQYPFYVNCAEIERLALSNGYKASQSSRRCREMESGINSKGEKCDIVLERRMDGKSVEYRATPPKESTKYIADGKEFIINYW